MNNKADKTKRDEESKPEPGPKEKDKPESTEPKPESTEPGLLEKATIVFPINEKEKVNSDSDNLAAVLVTVSELTEKVDRVSVILKATLDYIDYQQKTIDATRKGINEMIKHKSFLNREI